MQQLLTRLRPCAPQVDETVFLTKAALEAGAAAASAFGAGALPTACTRTRHYFCVQTAHVSRCRVMGGAVPYPAACVVLSCVVLSPLCTPPFVVDAFGRAPGRAPGTACLLWPCSLRALAACATCLSWPCCLFAAACELTAPAGRVRRLCLGADHRRQGACPWPTQQIWTVLQFDGTIHLGLWFMTAGGCVLRGVVGKLRHRLPGAGVCTPSSAVITQPSAAVVITKGASVDSEVRRGRKCRQQSTQR